MARKKKCPHQKRCYQFSKRMASDTDFPGGLEIQTICAACPLLRERARETEPAFTKKMVVK